MQPKTPGEKLLRIIESPAGKKEKDFSQKESPKEPPKIKVLSLDSVLKLIVHKGHLLSINNINKSLVGTSALLTVFALINFGINFTSFRKNINDIEDFSYKDLKENKLDVPDHFKEYAEKMLEVQSRLSDLDSNAK